MKRRIPVIEISCFAGAAAIIVARGLLPGSPWDEMLFPIFAFMLAVYLLYPVEWQSPRPPLTWGQLLPGVALLLVGSLLGVVILQAAGWTLAAARWMTSRIAQTAVPAQRVAWAFFLAFPWIPHDFPWVGWFFRLSGAAATAWVFEVLGFPVNQEGTSLVVGGLPMEIAPACAGLGLLQAMLVTGSLLLVLAYPTHLLFFLLLALLPVAAWMGNTLRMVVITAAGLSAGPEFAEGLFHTWGGLAAIAAMVIICLPLLWLLRTLIPDATIR